MSENIIERANNAIKALRKEKHAHGFPFMINTNELPPYHCYYEYPNGSIELVRLCKQRMDFVLVKKLTITQTNKLRKQLGL